MDELKRRIAAERQPTTPEGSITPRRQNSTSTEQAPGPSKTAGTERDTDDLSLPDLIQLQQSHPPVETSEQAPNPETSFTILERLERAADEDIPHQPTSSSADIRSDTRIPNVNQSEIYQDVFGDSSDESAETSSHRTQEDTTAKQKLPITNSKQLSTSTSQQPSPEVLKSYFRIQAPDEKGRLRIWEPKKRNGEKIPYTKNFQTQYPTSALINLGERIELAISKHERTHGTSAGRYTASQEAFTSHTSSMVQPGTTSDNCDMSQMLSGLARMSQQTTEAEMEAYLDEWLTKLAANPHYGKENDKILRLSVFQVGPYNGHTTLTTPDWIERVRIDTLAYAGTTGATAFAAMKKVKPFRIM
jgi:hypothetical protein